MLRLSDAIVILRDVFSAPSTLEKSRTDPRHFTRTRKLLPAHKKTLFPLTEKPFFQSGGIIIFSQEENKFALTEYIRYKYKTIFPDTNKTYQSLLTV